LLFSSRSSFRTIWDEPLPSKASAHGYELFATYTWSHAIDDAPEQNNIDSGNTVTLSDPSNGRRDRGNSLTDRRHVLNVTGVFALQFRVGGKVARFLLNLSRRSISMARPRWLGHHRKGDSQANGRRRNAADERQDFQRYR